MKPLLKKLVGITGLVAVALGMAGTAYADPVSADEPATLEHPKLVVWAMERTDPMGDPVMGGPLDDDQLRGMTPVEGAYVSVSRVTSYDGKSLDLSDQANWKNIPDASDFDENKIVRASGEGSHYSIPTDASGKAAFSVSQRGVYLVSAGGSTSAAEYQVMGEFKPFLVTLPMPDGHGGFTPEVHVYPKLSTTKVMNTLSQTHRGNAVGDTVSWDVSMRMGVVDPTVTTFGVAHKLSPGLRYVHSVVRTDDPDVELDPSYYTVTTNTSPDGVEESWLTLTEAGYQWWHSLSKPVTLTWSVDTTVVKQGKWETSVYGRLGSYVIANDEPVTDVLTAVPYKIIKHAAGTGTPLPGAVFTIHTSREDALSGENPVSVNGQSEFTTNDQGEVLLDSFVTAPGRSFWVREKTAPSGYMLAEPVEITPEGREPDAPTGSAMPYEPQTVTIEDSPVPVGTLPRLAQTGAQAAVLIGAGAAGLALMGTGVALVLVRRRKGQVA